MRTLNIIVLICFLSYTVGIETNTGWAQQPAARKTLAILPLTPTGIAPTEANALTNQLQNELVQTNSFIIIERARVDELLKEQGLAQTGCVTNECVAEAGKLLGAQAIVAGSVDKIGQTYNVVARLVDVETGRVSLSRNITHRGEIDGLLDKMHDLAQALASPSPAPAPTITPPALPPPRQFQLQIVPTPSDAAVSIDGQPAGQGTVTRTLPPSSHTVRVTKDNYTPWEQTVQLNQDQKLAANLNPIPKPAVLRYQLRIVPTPADAEVYINGQRAGQGTVTRTLPPGSYTVRVMRNKYIAWEQTVQLSQNQNLTASLTPMPKPPGGSKKWVAGLVVGLLVAGGGGAAAVVLGGKSKGGGGGGGGGGG
ncbi:MAG: PEGA domain-containing protein, partial [Candidatus Latescibacteria bacterium]|nr:PEGA domain-containing protein [Candidatus Latescibacterota bacterium]